MQMKRNNKLLSLLLCIVLTVAMALFTIGCKNDSKETTPNAEQPKIKATVLGEGATVFDFTVTDKDGNVAAFEIHTDKTIVGEALQELGLLEGEDSQYGLFVKKVNGITADYDVDKTYWAFYINGEYAMSGVDTTKITAGDSYSFKVEK